MKEMESTANYRISKLMDGKRIEIEDKVTVEEPLEIFINKEFYSLTMRLLGEEIPLTVGLLFTEGLIDEKEEILTIGYCDVDPNRIDVFLKEENLKRWKGKNLMRKNPIYSSCGICGKDMIEIVPDPIKSIEEELRVSQEGLFGLFRKFEKEQKVFPLTGGTHAASIFDKEGGLLSFSEDIGRHNALDKAIGKVLLKGEEKRAKMVFLTSRISYEMVMKAQRLGVEIIVGASSPTSLAIELARKKGITLVGFLRGKGANLYTHPQRIE